jgi:hypothetical protein
VISIACVIQPKDTSEAIAFTIQKPTAIDPVPASQYNIRLYPNPAVSVVTIDSLKISDRWYLLDIINSNGRVVYRSRMIANQSSITIDVRQPVCRFVFLILKKKSGESVYLKFVKQD